MKYILLISVLITITANAVNRIYNYDGGSVNGEIVEANNTHVTFRRESDHQLFRFKLSVLALESRQAVELYHSTERYNTIPTVATPLSDKTLRSYTSYIDSLVISNLKSLRVQPTMKASDSVYVRRLYLTVIGRIPTRAELIEFLNDRDSKKKDKLIQKLLNSPGYANHQINWFSDMLRVKDKPQGVNINVGVIYREWLMQALTSNKHYDDIVRELIASRGRLYDGGEEISYYLRDRGMQEDNLSHTIRIFLGTRLQCAMCHDHPFDKWTQKEFYEMTAFTSGVGRVQINDMAKKAGSLNKIIRSTESVNSGIYNNWRNQVRDSLQFGIESNGTGKIKLPKDFAESNGEPGDTVHAKAIFTPKPVLDFKEKDPRSRMVLAEWITSADNPRFTTMIANRLFKHVFGAGLIEPIDTMMDSTLPGNPKLMKYLERIMVSVDYDMKEYFRILLNTDLFQRKSLKKDFKSLEEYTFAGPMVRRMTGEQIWDSLVTLVYNNIDAAERRPGIGYDYNIIYERYKDMSPEDIYADFESLSESNPGERNFMKAIAGSDANRGFSNRSLIRSSYLPYPAPGGHLIRQFGGSDREQIDNSNSEPNTTQVLNLLNGFVEKNIISSKNADFIKLMQAEKSRARQVENIFMSILNRKPNSRELSDLKGFLDESDPNGYKHIAWILLNSHEFIFIQ